MPVASFFFPEDQHRIVHEFFPSVLRNGHVRDRNSLSAFQDRRSALDGVQGAERCPASTDGRWHLQP
jgi:hypothetical protein